MIDLATLDDSFYYPLYYKLGEQHCRYAMGHTTHKLPSEMNRHERRKVLKMQRRQAAKEAKNVERG